MPTVTQPSDSRLSRLLVTHLAHGILSMREKQRVARRYDMLRILSQSRCATRLRYAPPRHFCGLQGGCRFVKPANEGNKQRIVPQAGHKYGTLSSLIVLARCDMWTLLMAAALAMMPFSASADPLPRIPCQVESVYDGDTFTASPCRPWPGLTTTARVRVLDIEIG